MIFVRDIQAVVAKAYAVPVLELIGRSQDSRFCKPRQVAMYLSRELTGHSRPRIGHFFGDRDPTTVLHAERKIAAQMEKSIILRSLVDRLTFELARH